MTWLIVAAALLSFLCFAMALYFSRRPGPNEEAREDNLRLAGMLLFLLALILFAFREEAAAHDLAAWSDPVRDEWYRSLKVPQSKTSCCDMRDGAGIDPDKVRQDSFGNWWVDLGSGFVPVPPERVVSSPPSIDGLPYLFKMFSPTPDSPNGIRCFVPPVPTY